jgi:hypothetical protein
MKYYVLIALLAASPAFAQMGPTGGGYGGQGYGTGYGGSSGMPGHNGPSGGQNKDDADSGGDKPAKAAEPPPAIPGAQPDADAAVVPADRSSAEMSPNDALFDAIDRGDVAAAKDALSRGAQLDAKNVLGQNPIDAAIDLSRNDITFLLLSMRGAVAGTHAAPPVVTASTLPAATHGRAKKGIVEASATPPPPPDRGTPNPAVGFTGF